MKELPKREVVLFDKNIVTPESFNQTKILIQDLISNISSRFLKFTNDDTPLVDNFSNSLNSTTDLNYSTRSISQKLKSICNENTPTSLSLFIPTEVETILNKLEKIGENLDENDIYNIKQESEIVFLLVGTYIGKLKDNLKAVPNPELHKYISFWIRVSSNLELIIKQLPEPSLDTVLHNYLLGNQKSFKLLAHKIINWNLQKNLKSSYTSPSLSKMCIDWQLVEQMQADQLSNEELDDFSSKLVDFADKSNDITKLANVLAGVFVLIISHLNNPKFQVSDLLNLPNLKNKLVNILKQNIKFPSVLEPLHHILNYTELENDDIYEVLKIMSQKSIRESRISISLYGFYKRLKLKCPNHHFFKEQDEIINKINLILSDLKNSNNDDYELIIKGLTHQIGTTELSQNLQTKYIEITNLAAKIIISPKVFEIGNSSIGVEIEGNFQPGQNHLTSPLIPTIYPPKIFSFGYDTGNTCLEIRTNYTDPSQSNNAQFQSYLECGDEIIKFTQLCFSNISSIAVMPLHFHFDSVIHANIPKLWIGRVQSDIGIVGTTWESRSHEITAFSSAEYFLQFMGILISSQKSPNKSQVFEIIKGNLTPYFFGIDPIMSLSLQANHNYYNQFISSYASVEYTLCNLDQEVFNEVIDTTEFKNYLLTHPKESILILHQLRCSNRVKGKKLLELLYLIDFNKFGGGHKAFFVSYLYYLMSPLDNSITPVDIEDILAFILHFAKQNSDPSLIIDFKEIFDYIIKYSGNRSEIVDILEEIYNENILPSIESDLKSSQIVQGISPLFTAEKYSLVKISDFLNQLDGAGNQQKVINFIKNNATKCDFTLTHNIRNNQARILIFSNLLYRLSNQESEQDIWQILERIADPLNFELLNKAFYSFESPQYKLKSKNLILEMFTLDDFSDSYLTEFFINECNEDELTIFIRKNIEKGSPSMINRFFIKLFECKKQTSFLASMVSEFREHLKSEFFIPYVINLITDSPEYGENERQILNKLYDVSNIIFYHQLFTSLGIQRNYTRLLTILFENLDSNTIIKYRKDLEDVITEIKLKEHTELFIKLMNKNISWQNCDKFSVVVEKLTLSEQFEFVEKLLLKFTNKDNLHDFKSTILVLIKSKKFDLVFRLLDENLTPGNVHLYWQILTELAENKPNEVKSYLKKYTNPISIASLAKPFELLMPNFSDADFEELIQNNIKFYNVTNMPDFLVIYAKFKPDNVAEILNKHFTSNDIYEFRNLISQLITMGKYENISAKVKSVLSNYYWESKYLLQTLLEDGHKNIVTDLIITIFPLDSYTDLSDLENYIYLECYRGHKVINTAILNRINLAIEERGVESLKPNYLDKLSELIRSNSDVYDPETFPAIDHCIKSRLVRVV